jgi:hypothetical protein
MFSESDGPYRDSDLFASPQRLPQQHKQFPLTLLAEETGCGTFDPEEKPGRTGNRR